MSAEPIVAPVTQSMDELDTHHLYCFDCYPEGDVAVCGEDLTDCPETSGDGEILCVVCYDLELYPCEGCGE